VIDPTNSKRLKGRRLIRGEPSDRTHGGRYFIETGERQHQGKKKYKRGLSLDPLHFRCEHQSALNDKGAEGDSVKKRKYKRHIEKDLKRVTHELVKRRGEVDINRSMVPKAKVFSESVQSQVLGVVLGGGVFGGLFGVFVGLFCVGLVCGCGWVLGCFGVVLRGGFGGRECFW